MTISASQRPDARMLDSLIADDRIAEAEALARALLHDDDGHLHGAIGLARCALARGDLPGSIRWAERCARFAPNDMALQSLLAVLLIMTGRADEAVPLLEGRAERAATPTAAIALGKALAGSGALDRLVPLAGRTLRRFPVALAPLMAELADHAVLAGAAPGWAAADLGLRIVGAFAPPDAAAAGRIVRIGSADGPVLSLDLASFLRRFGRPEGGLVRVTLTLGPELEGCPLTVSLDGADLPGSPLRPLRHGAVEGCAMAQRGLLTGWAWCPGDPPQRVEVQVTDAHGRSVTVATDRPVEDPVAFGIEEGDYAFALDPADAGLAPGLLHVTAGPGRVPLAGSPVPWGAAGGRGPVPVRPPPPRPPRPTRPPAMVDVIVPVYRGRAETLACLRSVLATTAGTACEVVVIDDASPEPALARDLAALAADGRITLLRNDRNLGFPATVNRGLRLHPDRDVVLLNADTLVAGDWLARLRDAAHGAHDVGTVTPLSNDATILSYPSGKDRPPPPDAAQTAALDRRARAANAGLRVEVPVAVGFCVYIRRDCLDETGLFEEVLFGRGYGEENDFCLRARQRGWRHLAAADVFVAHVGGRSFGRQKTVLAARNGRVLEELHPGCDALIRDAIAADPLLEARRRLDLARWAEEEPEPVLPAVLLVTLAGRGGVGRFVAERTAALRAEGWRVLRLAPDLDDEDEDEDEDDEDGDEGNGDAPAAPEERRCRLDVADRPDLRDLRFRTRAEFGELAATLRRAGTAAVEIHHVMGHDPLVLDLPARLGVPYDLVVHDYSLICPRVNLVDGDGRYCGEPELPACERCTADPDDRFDGSPDVATLRRRTRGLVAGARRVTAPTRDVAGRLLRHVEPRPIEIRGWEEDTPRPQPRPPRTRDGRWRVCAIGAVGRQKGYDVLLACARDAAARDLPLEFVLVGFSEEDPPLFETGRVFVTGRFSEEEAVDLVRAQGAHLAFLPSISPETWCYALSTVWRAGLEAVVFDIGALAERIRAHGGGHILPRSLDAAAINHTLLGILDGGTPTGVAIARPVLPHPRPGPPGDAAASDGRGRPHPTFHSPGVTSMIASASPAEAQQSSPIKATAQTLALAPGFYSMLVTGGGAAAVAGEMPLPSVHLATAPGLPAGAGVEMIGTVKDGWLTKPGDTVVIKVTGATANIVLSSYKHVDRPNATLSLQFARIDDAPAQPAAAPVMAAAAPVVAPVAPVQPAPIQMAPLQAAPAPLAPVPMPPVQPAPMQAMAPQAMAPQAMARPARAEILAHVQRQGDLRFPDSNWAGCVGQRLWIEAFSITPVEGVAAEDLEYKGLTANGWETPWMSGGNMCGSRGLGTPLIGFSIRLRGAAAERFDCVYEGAFVSGQRSPAAQNGAPCRSDVIGDPLEAILLRIVPKQPGLVQPRPF